MNDEEKKELEAMRDDLIQVASGIAIDANLPPEERLSLLMAKIRTNPDNSAFEEARKTLDEIESPEIKLNASQDLIEEIEIVLGNVTQDDGPEEAAVPEPENRENAEEHREEHNEENHDQQHHD